MMKQGLRGGLGCARALRRDGAMHVGEVLRCQSGRSALKISCKKTRYDGKDRPNNFDEMAIKSESNEREKQVDMLSDAVGEMPTASTKGLAHIACPWAAATQAPTDLRSLVQCPGYSGRCMRQL